MGTIAQSFRPGDILPSEATLARRFGVSRPVIREALRTLAGQGVVEIVSGKGAIVQPVDGTLLNLFFSRAIEIESGAPMELMEVRKPLEVQSAALAARRRTPEELAAMKATVQAMRRQLDDLEAYADLDLQLHLLLAAATRNRMMEHLIRSIRESLRDTIVEGLRRRNTREELERVQVLHQAVLQAIERGDDEEAARAMAQHFDEAVTALIRRPSDGQRAR